jgi:Protein phosphatase 2C
MIERAWCWAGACSTGSSHIRTGLGCDDRAACLEFVDANRTALVAVVSDGAGSAQHASLGSRAVVRQFIDAAFDFLRTGRALSDIDQEVGRAWLDGIRDKISTIAVRISAAPRDLAATLVGVVASKEHVAICHVGDGACAIRSIDDQEWHVPSWPSHGEYASTTFFVTDDPHPNLRVSHSPGRFSDIAIFSDGLERLALDFKKEVPFKPFFDSMVRPLSGLPPGRDRTLSVALRRFLDSASVNDRTDDDKSLILATRART